MNAHAAEILTVPEAGLVPGGECRQCGALSADRGRCPDCGAAALPVPDLVDEMVTRTLQDGGHVYPVGDGLSHLAARLRFRLPR